jgi:hypothetical protein
MNSVLSDDALLTLAFSLHSSPGAYAVLIGAGVSASSGVPTAWGVLSDLTSRIAVVDGEDPGSEPVDWYEAKYGELGRYETVLERVARTKLARQQLLKGYFEPSAEDVEAGRKSPTEAHRALARMVRTGSLRIIVTLNFDRLIEQAVRDAGVEPTIVASSSDALGLPPLHTLDCCIIHLHGDYLNPTSMLNTQQELKGYPASIRRVLIQILRDYGLIIVGWSSTYDPALRAAIASHYSSRLPLVWIEPFPPSAEASQLLTLKRGLLMATDADTAFGRLADAVDALASRGGRHPLTVAVAVETAKRDLSGRQVAISLHDTVSREFARLVDHADFHLPDYGDAKVYGGYGEIYSRIEGASQVCCALVATLARWGGPSTDVWWIDEVPRFSTAVAGNGQTQLMSLRQIAGCALFYAACIAACAGRRYDLVGQLMRLKLPDTSLRTHRFAAQDLDPLTTYQSATGGSRLLAVIRPLLKEVLALSDEALDDTWQLFEVMRLAQTVISDDYLMVRLIDFNGASEAYENAQRAVEQGELTGIPLTRAGEELSALLQVKQKALGAIAGSVAVGQAHVLTVNAYDGGWRSPVAERLVADLSRPGAGHPLPGFDEGGNDYSNARRDAVVVSAVSIALGAAGRALAWRRIEGVAGTIPSSMWLDTGKSFEEAEQERINK